VERYNRIAFSIATKHIANHDFPSALRLLNTIAKDSEDIHLLSAIARVYYQVRFVSMLMDLVVIVLHKESVLNLISVPLFFILRWASWLPETH
jgi:hypothetical protein